jgi:hypothetical protein
LKTVGGALRIGCNIILTSLEGLHGVTSVGKHLRIDHNDSLTTVDGLRCVTNVGGNLYIRDNPALTTVEGLRSVTNVDGYLYIRDNPALTTLEGLRNLEVIRNTGGYSTSLDLLVNPKLARGLPFPKLRVNNGGVYLGGGIYPAPNAYVASHCAALERVSRA